MRVRADDGTLKYAWDAFNRLTQVKRVSDDATIATYTYDALNRRVRMIVANQSGGVPNDTTDCIYDGWRCVEERGGGMSEPTRQYIWGIYDDELIQQKNIVAINNFSANSLLYPLQDLLYRTTALADASGTLREAYDYDAYGNTLVFRNSGSPPSAVTWSSDTQVDYPTCPFLFTGQRFDAETGLYYYKRRFYSPIWGRFLSRDPADSDWNLYLYVGDSPVNRVDPSGLMGKTAYCNGKVYNAVLQGCCNGVIYARGLGGGPGGVGFKYCCKSGKVVLCPPPPPPPGSGCAGDWSKLDWIECLACCHGVIGSPWILVIFTIPVAGRVPKEVTLSKVTTTNVWVRCATRYSPHKNLTRVVRVGSKVSWWVLMFEGWWSSGAAAICAAKCGLD